MSLAARTAAMLFVVAVGSSGQAAESPEAALQKRVQRLIRELNSDTYKQRQAATRALIAIGSPALPQLRKASQSPSLEVRYRVQTVIRRVMYGDLAGRFAKLAATKNDADIDVEEGMWLIARIVDGPVEKRPLVQQLDDLAAQVRRRLQARLGKDADPARAPAEEAIAALQDVLFAQAKFTGATRQYDHPKNSSLAYVLKTRKGLPILLSHVVVAVARRLKIPIVGIGIPGRYMCKYDGSLAPGKAMADVIIDPFGGGRTLTAGEFRKEFGFDPASYLKPDGHRSAIDRMLRNLAADYEHVGNPRMAELVHGYEAILEPKSP